MRLFECQSCCIGPLPAYEWPYDPETDRRFCPRCHWDVTEHEEEAVVTIWGRFDIGGES